MRSRAEVVVRRAAAGEIERVLAVARRAASASHWTQAAYEKYRSGDREDLFHRCLLVAVNGDEVTGFVAGSYLEGDDAALLENLAVDAAWRRRGVASELCYAMMAWAKGEGAGRLQLEVRVSNAAAQALYAELGFVEEGRRKKYYSDPEEDGVMMALEFR